MLSEIQKKQLIERQTSEESINKQIAFFKKGYVPVNLSMPASPSNGIEVINEQRSAILIGLFDNEAPKNEIVKFVPASGAATRMFKSLFEFLKEKDKSKKHATSHSQTHQFFFNLPKFAFYNDLSEQCSKNNIDIKQPQLAENEDSILNLLLDFNGLNYGSLPKGLLKFHSYNDGARTAFEEHLVEAALHAKGKGNIKIHFTVSPEHISSFNTLLNIVLPKYEKQFNTKFEIAFSIQKPSTDTISVDVNGQEVTNADGTFIFRPGGHGALLENLSDLNADIIFIKNIDNTVPDHLKADTIKYKKIIAGLLIDIRSKVFEFQQILDSQKTISDDLKQKMVLFAKSALYIDISTYTTYDEFRSFMFRPIRVCGMVKNLGEPGGGPFWVYDTNKNMSLQIVESSQIDANNAEQKEIFGKASHFNPVDLVCCIKNYKDQKFNLADFRDDNTGFITNKSVGGKEIKVQELPGLWNGSMAFWNTIFVEVPVSTFNPVKTVNDLLRPEHQGK